MPRRAPAATPSPGPIQEPRLPAELTEGPRRLEPGTELSGAHITGDVEVEGLEDAELHGCLLEDVRLTATSAARLTLTDVVLRRCELSGADLDEARWHRVRVEDCRAEALDAGRLRADHVVVSGTKLRDAGLRMSRWEHATFTDTDLRGVELHEARLLGAALEGCDLTGAVLTRARLTGARLDRCTLHDLVGASALAGAAISEDQVYPVALALMAELKISLASTD
jgi:uncharacterized protein YjbI with pentapeptide repeats